VKDFKYHEEEDDYECPQGKRLEYKGTTKLKNGEGKVYQANAADCRTCPCFSKCIWSKKEQSKIGRGKKLYITKTNEPGSLSGRMREKQAAEEYQEKYSRRIQIAEPLFANTGYCKGLNRFTLRGTEKVNGQWQLYCMVHNLGKCLDGFNAGEKCA